MNSTCNCTCYDDNSVLSNNTTGAPSNYKPQVDYFAIAVFLFLVFLAICGCVYLIYAKYRSYRIGPLNYNPVVPWWFGPNGPIRTRHFKPFGVVVQTRNYYIRYVSDKRNAEEQTQDGIEWIQWVLKKRFGMDANKKPNVYIPKNTCLVSVPMENFKCGQEPTDFEPVSGKAPGSFLTYQMCGANRIQITRYVEDDVVYVAGYCVYFRDAYAGSIHYNIGHIQKCYKGPRYVPLEPPMPLVTLEEAESMSFDSQDLEDDKDSDSDSDANSDSDGNLQSLLPILKVHYCKLSREPVLIGFQNDILKHYQWNRETRTFNTSVCSSCQMNDEPPAYHLLEV